MHLNSYLLGKYPLLFLLLMLGSADLYAQFDSVAFVRRAWHWDLSVIYLGDQNNDGYDDFVLVEQDSADGQLYGGGYAHFFYGGNPLSSTPAFSIRHPAGAYSITACDINRDNYRDLIIGQKKWHETNHWYKVYFGGPAFDTLPDMTFNFPDTTGETIYLLGREWPADINGDGWEELIICQHYFTIPPDNGDQTGTLYFFETSATTPLQQYHTYTPPIEIDRYGMQWSLKSFSFTDIDGDGRADPSFVIGGAAIPGNARRYLYGDNTYSFNEYSDIKNAFASYTTYIFSVPDMNGDGKADIITKNVLNDIFPFYFGAVMFNGSKPVNTTAVEGFNTQANGWSYLFSPGDVNGDSYNDVVFHTYYTNARLYLGGNPVPDEKARVYAPLDPDVFSLNFGGRIGDVTGDGADDICIMENAYYDNDYPMGNTFIVKGTRKPTGVEDEPGSELPREIELRVNPNPFNPETVIRYALPSAGYAKGVVYDILGREVATLLDGEKSAGKHELKFNAAGLPSGVYIFRLEAGKHSAAIKMVVSR